MYFLLQLLKKFFRNIFCHDLSLRGVSKHKYVQNTSTCLEHEKKMSKCITVLLALVIQHLHFKKKIGCKPIFKNLNRFVENTSTCVEHGKNAKMCHCAIGGGHSVILFNISKKNIGKVPARQLSSDISNKRQPQNCSRLSFF